jgi:hypothetical protein
MFRISGGSDKQIEPVWLAQPCPVKMIELCATLHLGQLDVLVEDICFVGMKVDRMHLNS